MGTYLDVYKRSFQCPSGYYDMKKEPGGRWIMLLIFSLNHEERP